MATSILVTSMSQTRSGARAMAQAELASPVLAPSFPAHSRSTGRARTSALARIQYRITSMEPTRTVARRLQMTHPAIGGFDDPNADPPTTSVDDIIDAIPCRRPDHYIGTRRGPVRRQHLQFSGRDDVDADRSEGA